MKVFLDDMRNCPQDWVRVSRVSDAIALLKTGLVTEISLDHDLGANKAFQPDFDGDRENGYAVILWIEEQVMRYKWHPPKIHIHTDNPAGRAKMEAGVKQIHKYMEDWMDRELKRMGG